MYLDLLSSPHIIFPAGADMSYPCQGPSQIQVRPCMEGDPTQLWVRQPDGTISLLYDQDLVLDDFQCNSTNGSPVVLFSRDNGTGTCGGVNQKWVLHDDQTITNVHNGLCLDVYEFVGPQVDLWQCNGGQNQAWISRGNQLVSAQTGLCLKAVSACANVWGRPLQDGSWAMAMINNLPNPTMVTCDGACFSQTTLSNACELVKTGG